MAPIKTNFLTLAGFGWIVLLMASCTVASKLEKDTLPSFLVGEFEDDYGVQYHIDNKVLRLLPNDAYYLVGVNENERYIILQNDSLNAFAPSLYTRIDYEKLENMAPYEWAFCFSSYEEASIKDAIKNVNTDKSDMMSGCNGFPFSRMKRVGESD